MCSNFPSTRPWLYQNRSSLMLGASLPWKLVVRGEHSCIFVSIDMFYWLAIRAQRALIALSSPHGTSATPPTAQDPISAPSAMHQWDATALPARGHCGARSAHVPAGAWSLPLSHTCLVLWGVPSCPQPAPLPRGDAETDSGWCFYAV